MLGIGESSTSERVDHAEQHEDLGGLVEQDREQVQGAKGPLVGPLEEEVGVQVIEGADDDVLAYVRKVYEGLPICLGQGGDIGSREDRPEPVQGQLMSIFQLTVGFQIGYQDET
jgi:hypothetical protein